MDEINKLFEEKMKVALGHIRTNNTGDDSLKYTQSVDNLTRAWNLYLHEPEPKPIKKQGTGAT